VNPWLQTTILSQVPAKLAEHPGAVQKNADHSVRRTLADFSIEADKSKQLSPRRKDAK